MTGSRFFKGTVITLKVLLQMELDRQDNNEQIVAVYQIMANMVHPLRFLKREMFAHGEMANPLEEVMKAMLSQMKEFGQVRGRLLRQEQVQDSPVSTRARLSQAATSFRQGLHRSSACLE
ncbi:hypothetical protein AURDEDRAFT_144365 [Auricularia subglabra TFB-10046 SS5]|nr:hypothetical protein AURDEDRAFT_144365 [Auricularia subglabra TFB-10046 SS5]